LGCRNAKERFAEFLLRLAERTDVLWGAPMELTMGRQDIADHLGVTIESICRSIAALKKDGLVTVPNKHQLILNNVAKLRAVADGRDAL
jgi:CRP-like cAMP-binding protein